MLVHIRKLLSPEKLTEVQRFLDAGEFTDGRSSAGTTAARVKQNLQLTEDAPAGRDAGKIVAAALQSNGLFWNAVRPKAMLAPVFSRYEEGMQYGEHLDNPLMGGEVQIRTDVSVTVFLNDPADYDGGELVIHSDYSTQAIKCDAGDGFAYPSNLFHSVNAVTRGTRLVAVTWVQSMVRDPARRRILFDLADVAGRLTRQNADDPSAGIIQRCHMNLTRMWADV